MVDIAQYTIAKRRWGNAKRVVQLYNGNIDLPVNINYQLKIHPPLGQTWKSSTQFHNGNSSQSIYPYILAIYNVRETKFRGGNYHMFKAFYMDNWIWRTAIPVIPWSVCRTGDEESTSWTCVNCWSNGSTSFAGFTSRWSIVGGFFIVLYELTKRMNIRIIVGAKYESYYLRRGRHWIDYVVFKKAPGGIQDCIVPTTVFSVACFWWNSRVTAVFPTLRWNITLAQTLQSYLGRFRVCRNLFCICMYCFCKGYNGILKGQSYDA